MTREALLAAATGLLLVNALEGRTPAGASFEGRGRDVRATEGGHLGVDNTLGELLHHPAFAGFARLILPWDDRAYDERMPLSRIGSLLPYHSHVDAKTVASGLNRMVDEAARGRTVFYRFCSDAERKEEPARSDTGLFFFRGRPGAPFAVVCPGGGFSYVGSVHEGFPHAAAIAGKGYNAFVLKYRAGRGEATATRDLAAAITYIHHNAETLGVGTSGYSLWGSSAGARMAAAIGSHGVARYGGGDLPKPSAVVLALHRALGSCRCRASHVRRGGAGGRDRPSRRHEEEGRRPPQAGHASGVPRVRAAGARLRARHRNERRGLGVRSHPVLGDVDTRAGVAVARVATEDQT